MLLVLLADGQLRSGEWLAQQLHVSRAAVWKAVQRRPAHSNVRTTVLPACARNIVKAAISAWAVVAIPVLVSVKARQNAR